MNELRSPALTSQTAKAEGLCWGYFDMHKRSIRDIQETIIIKVVSSLNLRSMTLDEKYKPIGSLDSFQ